MSVKQVSYRDAWVGHPECHRVHPLLALFQNVKLSIVLETKDLTKSEVRLSIYFTKPIVLETKDARMAEFRLSIYFS